MHRFLRRARRRKLPLEWRARLGHTEPKDKNTHKTRQRQGFQDRFNHFWGHCHLLILEMYVPFLFCFCQEQIANI